LDLYISPNLYIFLFKKIGNFPSDAYSTAVVRNNFHKILQAIRIHFDSDNKIVYLNKIYWHA